MEKSKKRSANEPSLNEGFRRKNVVENNNQSTPELKKEVEKDVEGCTNQVDRARYVNQDLENSKPTPKAGTPTESIHQTPETAEHKDFNSNPNPEEFPSNED
jgi:hypothetical protein